jgi:NAD(P)-dependent dehydrogenase (short-subunit alcohol dehydrogenase family)
VLVNNAGISGELGPGWVQDPTTLDLDLVRTVVETNVIGVIRVTNAMLPRLRRSSSPRIVNISSSALSCVLADAPVKEVVGGRAAIAATAAETTAGGRYALVAPQFAGAVAEDLGAIGWAREVCRPLGRRQNVACAAPRPRVPVR